MHTPHILAAHDSMVLLVDMQTGLLPAIHGAAELTGRVSRLLSAARRLNVPVFATEHCADKIGATDPQLAALADQVLHKVHFDATRETDFLPRLPVGRHHVLVVGTEAHVCVLQTALGLANSGLHPWLVADCVGSRRESDRAAALQRWLQSGGNIVSSEMAMFEWLGSAKNEAFRDVLALVKGDGDTIVSSVHHSVVSE
jgi:nicotinamidase-related amidase